MLTASVIGAGMGGNASLKALKNSPHYDLRAVADISEAARAQVRKQFADVDTFGDWQAMFRECPTDVVVVSVPPALHRSAVMDALELPLRGILVEKPLGHCLTDGRAILNTIRERGLPIGVPHGLLVQTTPRKVLAHVSAGDIGQVQLIEIRCTGWDIINAGIHWLDFCITALDSPDMDHVMALCDTSSRTYRDGLQVETVAATYAVTREGTRIVMQTGDFVDTGRPGRDTLMRFCGDKGTIEFWPWSEGYRIVNADHPGGADLAPENRETRTPHQVHLDNLALQIDDGTADYTIAEDSLKALEICDAAYRSSFHRCRVNLPLDEFVPPPARNWYPGQPYAGTGGGRNGRRLAGSP